MRLVLSMTLKRTISDCVAKQVNGKVESPDPSIFYVYSFRFGEKHLLPDIIPLNAGCIAATP